MESTVSGEASSTVTEGETAMQPQPQPPLAVKKMKVMVAIDDSDESFYALKWTLDYLVDATRLGTTATTTAQSNQEDEVGMITAVHVQQPFHDIIYPAGPGLGTAVYATSTALDSVRKAQEHNSAAILSRALQMCKEKMVKVETLIFEGDPKDMICQAVEQMHVDLLVVGSRGLGMIKRAFLGSVSDYCAHHAICPILIVKPPKVSHE